MSVVFHVFFHGLFDQDIVIQGDDVAVRVFQKADDQTIEQVVVFPIFVQLLEMLSDHAADPFIQGAVGIVVFLFPWEIGGQVGQQVFDVVFDVFRNFRFVMRADGVGSQLELLAV